MRIGHAERVHVFERVADIVGAAAALADPITGEGIYYALRSAALLAAT